MFYLQKTRKHVQKHNQMQLKKFQKTIQQAATEPTKFEKNFPCKRKYNCSHENFELFEKFKHSVQSGTKQKISMPNLGH